MWFRPTSDKLEVLQSRPNDNPQGSSVSRTVLDGERLAERCIVEPNIWLLWRLRRKVLIPASLLWFS
jgi:hypothetical protein